MIIDRDLTALANFYALVKESNPFIDLTDVNVIVGVPEAVEGPNGTNTKLLISSIKNKGYSGNREIYYGRCTLTQDLESPPEFVVPLVGETVTQYAERVLGTFNILTSQVTVNNGNGFSLTQANKISPVANSLVYVPGEELIIGISGGAVQPGFYRFTVGQYSSIPYKGTEADRYQRWGRGVVGSMMAVDISSGHQPPAGTVLGAWITNPDSNLFSFDSAYHPNYVTDGFDGHSINLAINKRTGNLDGRTVRIANETKDVQKDLTLKKLTFENDSNGNWWYNPVETTLDLQIGNGDTIGVTILP